MRNAEPRGAGPAAGVDDLQWLRPRTLLTRIGWRRLTDRLDVPDVASTPTRLTDVSDPAALAIALAPVAMATLDRRLTCTWANPRFADLTGMPTADAAIGRRLQHLLPIDHADVHAVLDVVRADREGLDLRIAPDPAAVEVWRLHVYPLTLRGRTTGLGILAEVETPDDDAAESMADDAHR